MIHRLIAASLFSLTVAAAGCTGHATITATTTPAPAPMPAPAPAPAPAPVVVQAAPAAHPAYLHALSDLRHARALLARPAGLNVKWDENNAIREVDASINEIKHAAIDDGKPMEDHPPIDEHMEWGGRLQKARELIETAKHDSSTEEDNGAIAGLRGRAVHHMDEAVRFINEGIEDSHHMAPPVAVAVVVQGPAAQHPAYLHALTDLRMARAWLEKPAKPDVKFDENESIHQIDEAINEIKKASIDDGKPVGDHPPVDVAVAHRDRLRKAMELLHGAAADIEQKEDDKFATGLRHRALEHIRKAENDVHHAVEDRKGR
jgi:hypothetical protein